MMIGATKAIKTRCFRKEAHIQPGVQAFGFFAGVTSSGIP